MDKQSLIRDMKSYCNSSFITKRKLANYMGIKDCNHVNEYLRDLERINGKYYFIPDVAARLKERCTV